MGATLRCGEGRKSRPRAVYCRRLGEAQSELYQRLFVELSRAGRNSAQILWGSSRWEIALRNRVRRRNITRAGMDLSPHDRFPARTHHYFAAEKLSTLVANLIALAAIGVAILGSLLSCRRTESGSTATWLQDLRRLQSAATEKT